VTNVITSPRRFPSYSCDRDPQPLFDELDAVLAEFGVCLTVKQEERLRRRFARGPADVRAQAQVLVPFANLLLAQSERPERLTARGYGEYVLQVPSPPRPPAPAPFTRAVSSHAWQTTLRPANDGSGALRVVLALLWLCNPMLWRACSTEPAPSPPAHRPPLELMLNDPQIRRTLDELTRDLARENVTISNGRALNGARNGALR